MHKKLLRQIGRHLDAAKRRGGRSLIKYRSTERQLAKINRSFYHKRKR